MTEIRAYLNRDHSKWDAYVRGHPQGTIFHLINWKKVVEETFGHQSLYLLAQEEGEETVRGVLPLFEIKSFLFGHYLVSVPFAELGGPLADDEDTVRKMLDKVSEYAQKKGAGYVELKNAQAVDGFPVKDLYYHFQREIHPDPDDNLQAIPRKQRRMVRVGLKSGMQAEFGGEELLGIFYELLATNFQRLGTPIFPKKLFRTFMKYFPEDSGLLIVRNDEGEPIAGVLSFYYQDKVMPYYAGSLAEYRKLAPNDFMYWKLLDQGRELGYKWFDFGRSKVDTGSYKFKKHWGVEPVPLNYQYILNKLTEIPDISPANPRYQKKIELWRKLPCWATKVIGPRISRYLS